MKRQSPEVATRVYKYGTVPQRIAPVCGADQAATQLRLANRLWNLLVKIDHVRRDRYRNIMRDDQQQAIEELQASLKGSRQMLLEMRKQARKKNVQADSLKASIAEDKARLTELITARKESATQLHENKRAELDALNARTDKRIVRARQAAARMGLFWGTYNDMIQRADTGRKKGELQFRRYAGDGTLTAQIMGGAAVGKCVGADHTFFRIDAAIDGQRWRMARMRIGSSADRSPVWLAIPIVYHRDIPANALIKSVSITKQGNRYSLNVTVTLPQTVERSDGPAIAMDLGWRKLDRGDRVGYWRDTADAHGEVVVSRKDLSAFGEIKRHRSTCDLMHNEILPPICAWLDGVELSADWKDRTRALSQWRSSDRLAALVRWWADNRLPEDGEVFTAAVAWREQYLHLANWWRSLSTKVRGRIREQYRIFAASLARRYATLYLEDFDLREVVRDPLPESNDVKTASSSERQKVSPSELRAALVNACQREGVRVVKLPAEYTTSACHVCGHHEKWDQAAEVMHKCSRCETMWDQDHNAAINLLQLGERYRVNGIAPLQNQGLEPHASVENVDRSQIDTQ